MSGSPAIIAVAALCGCGEVTGTTVDAATVDDAPRDGADGDASSIDAGPSCWRSSFTTPPALVANVNSAVNSELYARLSHDGLTMVLVRDAIAFSSVRGSVTSPFPAPTRLVITGNGDTDELYAPTMPASQLELFFVSSRTGTTGSGDIWKATRASPAATFGNIVLVRELNSPQDESDVYIRPDGQVVYFSSARSGFYNIFRATRRADGSFNAPTHVTELANNAQFVNRVVISPDDLTVVFQEGNDIHIARRASTTEPFGTRSKIDALNTPNADQPTYITPDGCELYFHSNRPGTTNAHDIYVATRSPT